MSRMTLPKELLKEPTSNTKERSGMTGNQRMRRQAGKRDKESYIKNHIPCLRHVRASSRANSDKLPFQNTSKRQLTRRALHYSFMGS